jgi:hypothetical protein
MVALRRPLRLKGRWRPLRDGLYRVATTKKVHGGFLVHRRRIVRCSPAIRRYLRRFAVGAEYWGSLEDCFTAASERSSE